MGMPNDVRWLGSAVLASLLASVIWAGVVRLSGNDSQPDAVPGGRGAPAPRTRDVSESAGWFDANGNRQPIVYRDSLTPWADQASFNILTGTKSYGDERSFFDGRLGQETDGGDVYKTRLNVQPGDRIVLRVYIHNGADPAVNSSVERRGDAIGTRVRITMPDDRGQHLQLYAFISALNAKPEWVADGLDVVSDHRVRLSFVTGTGRLYGKRLPETGLVLSDDGFVIASQPSADGPGSLVGADRLDGVVPADGFGSHLVADVEVRVDAA